MAEVPLSHGMLTVPTGWPQVHPPPAVTPLCDLCCVLTLGSQAGVRACPGSLALLFWGMLAAGWVGEMSEELESGPDLFLEGHGGKGFNLQSC